MNSNAASGHRTRPAAGPGYRRASDDSQRWQQGIQPLDLRVGGIMTLAGGVGVALLAGFIRLWLPTAVMPVVGVGVLAVCIGVGLLTAAAAVERHAIRTGSGGPGA